MFFYYTPINKYCFRLCVDLGADRSDQETTKTQKGAPTPFSMEQVCRIYIIGNKIKVRVVKRIISIFVATVATHFSLFLPF